MKERLNKKIKMTQAYLRSGHLVTGHYKGYDLKEIDRWFKKLDKNVKLDIFNEYRK